MGPIRATLGIAFGSVALSACGAVASTHSTSTSIPTSTLACVATARVVCITRSSEGVTTRAKVAQTIKVVLGGSLRWSGPRLSGPSVLREVGTPVTHGGKEISSYLAVGKGRVTLEATGAPICSIGKACPQFILLWQAQVLVTT